MTRSTEGEERRKAGHLKAYGDKVLAQLDPQDGWLNWQSSPYVMWLGWMRK